jgi:hypothetical protein
MLALFSPFADLVKARRRHRRALLGKLLHGRQMGGDDPKGAPPQQRTNASFGGSLDWRRADTRFLLVLCRLASHQQSLKVAADGLHTESILLGRPTGRKSQKQLPMNLHYPKIRGWDRFAALTRTCLALLALAGLLLFNVTAFSQDTNLFVFLGFGQSNMEGFPGIELQDKGPVDDRFQVLAAVGCPKSVISWKYQVKAVNWRVSTDAKT